jgi:hypothetical protein
MRRSLTRVLMGPGPFEMFTRHTIGIRKPHGEFLNWKEVMKLKDHTLKMPLSEQHHMNDVLRFMMRTFTLSDQFGRSAKSVAESAQRRIKELGGADGTVCIVDLLPHDEFMRYSAVEEIEVFVSEARKAVTACDAFVLLPTIEDLYKSVGATPSDCFCSFRSEEMIRYAIEHGDYRRYRNAETYRTALAAFLASSDPNERQKGYEMCMSFMRAPGAIKWLLTECKVPIDQKNPAGDTIFHLQNDEDGGLTFAREWARTHNIPIPSLPSDEVGVDQPTAPPPIGHRSPVVAATDTPKEASHEGTVTMGVAPPGGPSELDDPDDESTRLPSAPSTNKRKTSEPTKTKPS